MVKLVCFYKDKQPEEFERSFPGGVMYAAERAREVLMTEESIEGYFLCDEREYAIVERGIFFFNSPIRKGITISLSTS